MGKVFTFEEIERWHVPMPGTIYDVARFIRKELAAAPEVVAALMLGSCMRGDYTSRSDIDVLVLYNQPNRQEVIALMQDLDRVAHKLYVPVQFIPQDAALAESGAHGLSATFFAHFNLAMAGGGLIKENPTQLIQCRSDVAADIKAYLIHKMEAFERGEIAFDSLSAEQTARLLGKALSFPVYAGRMMIQRANISLLQGSDTKDRVAEIYPELGIRNTSGVFFALLELDQRYSEILVAQITRPDAEDYYLQLEQLKRAAIPLARELAFLNLCALL